MSTVRANEPPPRAPGGHHVAPPVASRAFSRNITACYAAYSPVCHRLDELLRGRLSRSEGRSRTGGPPPAAANPEPLSIAPNTPFIRAERAESSRRPVANVADRARFTPKEGDMRLSTRSRYGIRALTALAAHEPAEGRCAREIADEEELSKKYLESILAQLRTAGLVRSVRGAHGGYVLAKDPVELTVGEVIRVLEGSLAFVECVDDPSYCDRFDDCVTRYIWEQAEQVLTQTFDGITIASLVERRRRNHETADAASP